MDDGKKNLQMKEGMKPHGNVPGLQAASGEIMQPTAKAVG
jgi:hypothetical protein